ARGTYPPFSQARDGQIATNAMAAIATTASKTMCRRKFKTSSETSTARPMRQPNSHAQVVRFAFRSRPHELHLVRMDLVPLRYSENDSSLLPQQGHFIRTIRRR